MTSTNGSASTHGSITAGLVERILGVNADLLPATATDVAQQVVLDGIAVMLAGSTEPLGVGRIITDWVRDQGGAPQASVVAGGFKAPAMNAAYANGVMAYVLDFDNFWHPRTHPMSPSVPAILALAEQDGVSGRKVLAAVVVAFEVQIRLRMAAVGLDLGRGFHKPGSIGVMGSTAGCGWLLDLDHDQLASALGIAGSRAGSLAINTGTMTKSSHSGHAARMAVECAELARRGWTASHAVFDEGGWFDTLMGDRQQPDLLLKDFGDPYYMVDPGIGFKKYPSNGFTQRPIDAALKLRSEHGLEPAQIARVEVDGPPFDYVNRPSPSTGLEGKFSIQYATAVALLDGDVTVDSFSNDRRFAPDVEDLLPRVTLLYDRAIPTSAVDTFVRLRVHLRDGSMLACEMKEIAGMVGVPLSREQRLRKFFSCARRVLTQQRAETIVALVDSLPESDDISDLMAFLRVPDATHTRTGRSPNVRDLEPHSGAEPPEAMS